jgi:hypothetical protein
MELTPRYSRGARVDSIPQGWRLSIPGGDARRYRIAQLDNCTRVARRDFPYRSLDMRLRARVSSASVPGTWGFGVWNDPYRIALGRGETLLNALTLPNAAWFFFSSDASYLSFRDDKPGNGFLAQVFSAPSMPVLAMAAAAGTFIFSRVRARRHLSRIIQEDAARLDVDVTQWHSYRMNWQAGKVLFELDGRVVLETGFSPKPPMAAVIWIDNQFAAFTPQGRVAFGILEAPAGWMEITDLELKE